MNGDFAYVDEFDGPLAPTWMGLRTPRGRLYDLKDGALVLHAGQPLGDLAGVPGFVGRRQQHHDATVSTVVDYAPRRDGDRAGLLAMQNDGAWMFLGVAHVDGKRVVALYKAEGGKETLLGAAPAPAGKVELVMEMRGGKSAYRYRDGAQWKAVKTDVDVTFLSTQKAKGFVGVVIGPYVQAGGNN
jgi:alpha-N-arabinofuranosidase